MRIIVNGREKYTNKTELTYKEIVRLAHPLIREVKDSPYSVTYFRGPDSNKEGVLDFGKTIPLKEKMIFNVLNTSGA